jgi:ESCRT-II complex subunit VPS36
MLLLEGVALTDSGRPVLAPEELELRILEKTDAEFGERRGGLVSAPDERYRGGIAFLTTHRLIWLDQPALPSPGRSCSLHLSRVTSASPVPLKMFGSRTKRHALRCSANGGLGPSDEAGELRLAFRGESPESFARCLDDALKNRAWQNEHDPPNTSNRTPNRATTQTQTRNSVPSFPRGRSAYDAAASRSAPPPPPPPPPLGPSADQRATAAAAERDRMTSATRARHAGVGGALHRQKQEAEKDERVLGRAFTDMSEVMRRAGELVALAERFATATARKSEKTVGSDPSNEERKTSENDAASNEMREMLVSLGIASPVTKASAGALYHRQLSRQLADWLPQALAQNGGILALPDVFCLFNRARGAELVSPEDVLKACQLWQSLGIKNVQFRRFDSGTLVAHAADRSDDEVCAALMSATRRKNRGDDSSSQNENETVASRMDAFTASEALGVPPAIAREYLAMAEGHGILCRDEGPDTTWFYPNKFAEFSAVQTRGG